MKSSVVFVLLLFASLAHAQSEITTILDRESASLEALYQHLHANPELSYYEKETSRRIADELKKAGYEVTEQFGEYKDQSLTTYGVVGILRNGEGPVVMVRTDLDALPIEEKTELPYASRAKAKNDQGEEVSVMHACGHDMHMTVFIGAARALMAMKDRWKGTLIFIGQPAEERAPGGAEAMLRDGLYTKFPKPDYVLALHSDSSLPTGKLGFVKGYALASVDTVDITIRGAGGHGAYPHTAKDPIVIAAQVIMGLQTIVSREVPPVEAAVVTVGSIHGGTKHNIIPDEVKLQLTVRSYKKEIRDRVLSSIERITKSIAQAAGVPSDREPIVDLNPDQLLPSTYNNPELVDRTVEVWRKVFGEQNVVERPMVMAGEDFSWYSLEDYSVPAAILWLGSVEAEKVEQSERENKPLPSLHSSLFAPVMSQTIRTGVTAMTTAVLNLMGK